MTWASDGLTDPERKLIKKEIKKFDYIQKRVSFDLINLIKDIENEFAGGVKL